MTPIKKLFTLSLLVIAIISISCSSEDLPNCIEHEVTECNSDDQKANLRIKNGSQYDYCNVVVITGTQTINYGNILSGEISCLIATDLLYGYAYVQLFIDGNEFVVQPIDFVGEIPLGNGDYTYNITVPDINGNKYSVTLMLE